MGKLWNSHAIATKEDADAVIRYIRTEGNNVFFGHRWYCQGIMSGEAISLLRKCIKSLPEITMKFDLEHHDSYTTVYIDKYFQPQPPEGA